MKEKTDVTGWETAVLSGGPADGLRMKVADRPRVLQLTYPCQLEAAPEGMQVAGVYVYRRDYSVNSEPLQYGFDIASP
ncbi:hypothetical protein AB0D74_41600 [Streptomyces sp. NPDC048278]|uniref:hypothetical protein n=1 Tax=Streptomyces sp. NPDC048278 TaxID=3155809 RepID=UPI00343A614D